MRKILLICAMCFVAVFGVAEERIIAKVNTKGIILANQIEVCAMEDPDIKGITIFYTKSIMPLAEHSIHSCEATWVVVNARNS